ncbi:Protein of unknown function [Pyronema omphalodes CBS 100304]|uniref:Uncharacterized protein n=1 Tax=Pyronema omphalodes (strain CBS 100304) TaxID=1076935 RepID=U4LF21_PYROM|nr:Protein of unknown function [Pyronema omphalodes CBS 100304]
MACQIFPFSPVVTLSVSNYVSLRKFAHAFAISFLFSRWFLCPSNSASCRQS